jgi:hypothetical protein
MFAYLKNRGIQEENIYRTVESHTVPLSEGPPSHLAGTAHDGHS